MNSTLTYYNGYQPQRGVVGGESKFFDLTVNTSPSTTGSISRLSGVPQGVGATQREGDALSLTHVILNYKLVTQNSDIFTTTRLIVFQWKINDNLAVPTLGSILQGASSTTNMYNWQDSANYIVMWDKTFFQSGITTAPTDSGLQGETGCVIPITTIRRKITFNAGATSGTNHLYLLTLSDSIIAPFPTLEAQFRIVYLD